MLLFQFRETLMRDGAEDSEASGPVLTQALRFRPTFVAAAGTGNEAPPSRWTSICLHPFGSRTPSRRPTNGPGPLGYGQQHAIPEFSIITC